MTADEGKNMGEFPEVARRRLGRIATAGDHPDSGVLTAFVEGTLVKSHRQQLFNHLAGCAECNRVVAMIAPELELGPAVQPVAAHRGWFAWASLRWAGVAVVAAMALSAVWIGRINQTTPRPAASAAMVQPATSATNTAQVTPPPAILVQPTAPRRSPSRPAAPEVAKAAPAAIPSGGAQFDPAIAAQSRPAVPGALGQSAFQTSVVSNALPSSLPAAQPNATAATNASEAAVPAATFGPIWSVTGAGTLQHSIDGGKQWAAVPVPARTQLRVVAVYGDSIWTGGDAGGLYHSANAGQSWTAVSPTWNGQTLHTDIVRIAFTDLQHGWVVTRDGQIWMTPDGGASWTLKTGSK